MMKNQRKVVFSISQISAIILAGGVTCSVFADPVIDNVAAGQVSIQQSPGSTVVNQSSQQAIINWQSFNIGHGESAHFNQPVGGVALNRINPSQGVSQIYGSLTSTGQIILMNPAGFYFGPSAYVNVGGMIATTANITDQHFMNGLYQFSKVNGYSGAIINEGQLIAAQNGLIALVAPGVINRGLIQATVGKVVLGSADAFTLDFSGDHLINFAIDAKTSERGVDKNGHELADGVNNTGVILADGGSIILSAQSVAGVLDHSINLAGVTQAQSVAQQNGEVILSGETSDGTVSVAGKIDVSGKNANQTGGYIQITGYNLLLDNTIQLDASGDGGGGNINIGGGYQGQGSIAHARATVLLPGGSITADAINTGNGGNVVLWSDTVTRAYGTISAKGGVLSGNGGIVETSSKNSLDVSGLHVSTLAPNGNMGTWLLDPRDVTITNTVTAGGTFDGADPDVFTPISDDSTILNTDIQNNLANTSVTITTGATGVQAGNITVNAPITWSSANTLLLEAANNIVINNPITATAGTLQLNAVDLANSITTGASGTINVGKFDLVQGHWSQVNATLPAFVATDFAIAATNASFTRALSGDGAALTPYQLTDIYGLQGVMENSNYVLANDIDASSTAAWATNGGFKPIDIFSATFDGQSNDINNVTITSLTTTGNYIGLFGTIELAGVVENLNMVGGAITYTGVNSSLGSIAGRNRGLIDNTTSTMTLSGRSNVGGITGANTDGTISNSSFNGNILSGTTVGGIAGFNGATLTNVTNYANIILQNYYASAGNLGGIVGFNNIATVSNANNYGNLSIVFNATQFGTIGGIAGNFNQGTITTSNNYGVVGSTVSKVNAVGGIVGLSGSATIYINVINDGNVIGAVFANSSISMGGIMGGSGSTTNPNLINHGDVTLSISGNNVFANVGGLVGYSFEDTLSGLNTGRINVIGNPIYTSTVYVGGGVGNNEYSSAGYTNIVNEGNISVTNVRNATIGGVFGNVMTSVTNSSNTGDITFTSSIVGANAVIGGVVGTLSNDEGGNPSTLSNVYNTGSISANVPLVTIGGVLGAGGYTSSDFVLDIDNSYNNGAINVTNANGSSIVSGIANSYDNTDFGFVVTPTIENVYNTGYLSAAGANIDALADIANVTNSYWNTDTVGAASIYGAGLTTAQMQQQANYTGWDFGATWNIIAGQSYPYLRAFYATTPTIITGTAPAGSHIGLITNGVDVTVPVGANGTYYALTGNNIITNQDTTLTLGEQVLSYQETGGQVGNTVFTMSSTPGSFTLPAQTLNELTIGDGTVATYTSANLATILGSVTNPYALYSVSDNNIVLGNAVYTTVNLVTSATTTFHALGSIATLGSNTSTATFNGITTLTGDVTTTGIQNYNAATTLAANTVLTTTNSAVNLNALERDGTARNLTITTGSGAINLATNIGAGGALGAVAFNSTGATTVNGTLNAASLTTNAGGTTTINGGTITTSGAQTFNDAVILGADTAFNGAGGVAFNSTLDRDVGGARNVTVNAGAGAITMGAAGTGGNGAVGDVALNSAGLTVINGNVNAASVTTDAVGTSTLNGANITTTGNITFNDAVTLATVDKVYSSTGGAITFASTVAVDRALSLTSSVINFLNNLSGNSNINVTGTGGNAQLTVQTANNQTFNIAGIDAGTIATLGSYAGAFNFTDIQDVVGGLFGNTFHFADNATIAGTLNGSNLAQTNIVDITAYNQNMTVDMTDTNNGSIKNAGAATIANYINMTNTNANIANTNTINAPVGKATALTVTDGGIGYINDPLFFNGFNTLIGGNGSTVNFTVPFTYSSATGLYTVNGVTMTLTNFISSFIPPTPAQIPSVVANVIQQPPTNAEQNNNAPTVIANTTTPLWVLAGMTVDQNLTLLTNQAATEFENLTQKVKVNPYCYSTQ